MGNRVNIPITEEFLGRNLFNYDAYEPSMRETLAGQRHVNIRSFTPDSEEKWANGVIGPQSVMSQLPGLSLPIVNGLTTTSSVVPDHPVDLSTEFKSTDFISLALPSFPFADVNTVASFVDFTSNPEGNFAIGPTASVSLNSSIHTLISGDSEFRVERSAFEVNGLELKSITGVRFRIQGTTSATVIFAGLRLLASTWVFGPIDYDNWSGRWQNTVPVNGNTATTPAYTQPILWRSSDPPGTSDPRPIDSEIGITFYTGSQAHKNSVTLYLREESKAFLTQLDLDGTTMSALDGLPQPDLGISEYGPRLMTDMDLYEMEKLDAMDMFDIERTADVVFSGWIQFGLVWGTENTLTITNSSNPGYTFELPTLEDNTRYLLICSLEGTSARGIIYQLNDDFAVINTINTVLSEEVVYPKNTLYPSSTLYPGGGVFDVSSPTIIYDTTLIDDDNLFKRRKGRVGWKASLGDNDAFIDHIRTRHLNFAEYRSSPLTSITPVRGAQLFANFTQNSELWEGYEEAESNTSTGSTIVRDASRSTSGESYRIDVFGGSADQGFLSNPLSFTDFSQTGIAFDLWYPQALLTQALSSNETPGIELQLIGVYKSPSFKIIVPAIQPEQWQHISIDLSVYDLNPAATYRLQITQPSEAAGSWWIDSTSVFQRAVQWSARSVVSDPWNTNYAPWTDFHDIINSEDSGIIFGVQGKDLQMRAKALRQDANIVQPPKIVPTYAQLGRLVWPENALKGLTPPIANFTSNQVAGSEYRFKSTSTPGTGGIVLYEWSFGDGSRASGPVVTHIYSNHGTYEVTLVVTDRNGQQGTVTKSLTV